MKGFSLLEIIIAILIVVIITSFALPKFNTITDKSNITTLKSQLSLIQNAITENKNKNILLANNQTITNLDDASINKKDEKLFSKVIDFPILSTDSNEQKAGKWRKISNNTYEFFLSSSKTISFLIENEKIICKDKDEICKEIQ
ncbi:MAG: prepilin-type N-terminal cleavage/methylation domain-containing protein [Aliarcobacter sp.]|nr:prepilin-type N-terminal cleavage/methylation domain-containing protein [Aliarcobacter sp.]